MAPIDTSHWLRAAEHAFMVPRGGYRAAPSLEADAHHVLPHACRRPAAEPGRGPRPRPDRPRRGQRHGANAGAEPARLYRGAGPAAAGAGGADPGAEISA